MQSIDEQPMVSCLCVTERRPHLFLRAYASYRVQSYGNRELIVVLMDDDLSTKELVTQLSQEDPSITVVILSRDGQCTLGDRRNRSIEACGGEYICVWDDDDIYHADRIRRSMDALRWSGKNAAVLDRVVLYDASSAQAYLSTRRIWEQTLVCRKDILIANDFRYAPLDRGEDTALLLQLGKEIFPVTDPALYVYCFHGANTSSTSHFHEHLAVADRLPETQNAVIKQLAEQASTHQTDSLCPDDFAFQIDMDLVTDKIYSPWGVKAFSLYPHSSQVHTMGEAER